MRRVSILTALLLMLVGPLVADPLRPATGEAVVQNPVQEVTAVPCDQDTPAWLLEVQNFGIQTPAVQPQPMVWCPEPYCGGQDDCSFLCYNGGDCVRSGSCRFCVCNP